MWTPRRILLVVAGLALFGGSYAVYAHMLGSIDGLPPLPEAYTQELRDGAEIPTLPYLDTPIIKNLKLAFGPNCLEQTYKLKFEAREKGLLFAATDSKFLEDGRVQLEQVSIAVFGKQTKEISTVHADRAFITCDKPIRKLEDMGNLKIVSAELHSDPDYATHDDRKGKIHISNNRKTFDPSDDILVRTPGPIFYVEEPKPAQPHLWSLTHVELTDKQNRPLPTQDDPPQIPTVTAIGMRIYLTVDTPATAGAPKKADRKSASGVGGVERIDLDRNVTMNLWSESRNMFGGDPAKSAPPKPPLPKDPKAPPPEKVLVQIQTNGPFSYDMMKDKAHFEIPPVTDPNIVEFVTVTRKAKGNSEDTLSCDFLDVQFKRRKPAAPGDKTPPPPVSPDKSHSPDNDLEIETVHAWGKNIAMSSDSDALIAYGNDLVYDATIKQTVLKGAPMHAVKEGNLIRSPELILVNLDDRDKQHARARGPGQVGMGEIDPRTQEHGRQAHWKDWLVVTRIKEQGKDLDLITLTGNASFRDTMNAQTLTGKQIKLWLLAREENAGGKQPAPKKIVKVEAKKSDLKGEDGKQPLPHRLEAVGDVTARSPEMIINKTEYLNVWFKDLPPTPMKGPEKLPVARELPQPVGPVVTPPPMKSDPLFPVPQIDPSPKKSMVPEKRDPPLILQYARRVETWVNRIDGRNDLDKVHTEGNVVIHQDPTDENERGIDIAGETVDVEHYLEGNHLIVIGNDQVTGEVSFDKVEIVGDDIRIDQRDNTATVKGWGAMRLLSKTDLEGKELEKPTWIDIHWKESMELEGPIRSVRFEGGVQAKQNSAKVLCETMQVWLDRPLLLNRDSRKDPLAIKELAPKPIPVVKGAKDPKGDDGRSPKVVKVLCDQQPKEVVGVRPKNVRPVYVEDLEMIGGQILRYQNIQGTQVEMDNPKNAMTAIGPGTVRIFQAGSRDPLDEKPANAKAKTDEEMKLTWVTFDRRMVAYNKMPKRAIFFNNVEVVHMPASSHDAKINVSKLPERAMHMKCEESLEVVTRSRIVKDAKGKDVEVKWQELVAIGNVKIRSDEFDGMAGTVTYSEEKSLVVLIGSDKNPAVLNKTEVIGAERKRFSGGRITYNMKTKDFSVNDSVGGGTN